MRISKVVGTIATAFLMLSLAACTTTMPPAGTAAYQPIRYGIAAGDKIKITVFGEDSLSKDYTVSSAGDLSFPLIGDVPVAGKTVAQLQRQLVEILSQGYLNDPRVNAEVLNYRPFYILGEVGKAGEYSFSDDLTVFQAVALAGGFSYRADQSRVFIRRSGNSSEETYDIGAGKPVFVAPGDTIRVGERYF